MQDMHYAEFAEDEVCLIIGHFESLILSLKQSQALYNAIKEYENNKWKVIGQKVGKPAKVTCSASPSIERAATFSDVDIGMRTICKRSLWHR